MTSIAFAGQPPLLELRTDTGVFYLCPSRLERLRLRWVFRHFHILPAKLLSNRDLRMVERLSASAVVAPPWPLSRAAILGVVEGQTERASAQVIWYPVYGRSGWPSRWAPAGAMLALVIGTVLMLAATRAIIDKTRAMPVAHAATENIPSPVAVPAAPLPVTIPLPVVVPPSVPVLIKPQPVAAAKPVSLVASTSLPATELAPATSVATKVSITPETAVAAEAPDGERRWVTELPIGHFARPVVTQHSPAGEVQLNALIAPDGSVEQVTTISGDRTLAAAGTRAVRQWHYSPYAPDGPTVLEATRIKMNFFGPDAVSIASVNVTP